MQACLVMNRGLDWRRVMLGVLERVGPGGVSGRQVRTLERLGRVFGVMGVGSLLGEPVRAVDGTVRFEFVGEGGRVGRLVVRLDGGRYWELPRGGGRWRNHIRAPGGNGPVERKLWAGLRG